MATPSLEHRMDRHLSRGTYAKTLRWTAANPTLILNIMYLKPLINDLLNYYTKLSKILWVSNHKNLYNYWK